MSVRIADSVAVAIDADGQGWLAGLLAYWAEAEYASGESRLAASIRYFEMAPVQALVFAPVLETVRWVR